MQKTLVLRLVQYSWLFIRSCPVLHLAPRNPWDGEGSSVRSDVGSVGGPVLRPVQRSSLGSGVGSAKREVGPVLRSPTDGVGTPVGSLIQVRPVPFRVIHITQDAHDRVSDFGLPVICAAKLIDH